MNNEGRLSQNFLQMEAEITRLTALAERRLKQLDLENARSDLADAQIAYLRAEVKRLRAKIEDNEHRLYQEELKAKRDAYDARRR